MEKNKKKPWKFIIYFLLIIFAVSYLSSYFISSSLGIKGVGANAALIKINGVLVVEGENIFGGEVASSSEIVEYIKDANEDESIKAVVFEINSPGGSAVAAKEIVDAIKKVNKTTVSYIREIGASGGYWVASASEKIIADELSFVGSIGVIMYYLEFAGLLERYNITYRGFVGGKYKDMGVPFRELTSEEQRILQSKVDIMYDYFIKSVAENRNMSLSEIRKMATGEFYIGVEAKKLGLIDMFGNQETAEEYVKNKLNLTKVEFKKYGKPKTLFQLLSKGFSEQSFYIGRGIGAELTDIKLVNRLRVLT